MFQISLNDFECRCSTAVMLVYHSVKENTEYQNKLKIKKDFHNIFSKCYCFKGCDTIHGVATVNINTENETSSLQALMNYIPHIYWCSS